MSKTDTVNPIDISNNVLIVVQLRLPVSLVKGRDTIEVELYGKLHRLTIDACRISRGQEMAQVQGALQSLEWSKG